LARVTPVSEIFRACSTLDRATQIAYLRNTQSEPMRWMVQGAFHPNVKWLIPPGEPPYQPAPQRENEGFLHANYKKLGMFCEGGPELPQKKREAIFIQFLEALYPSDARMLLAVKDKTLPFGLTYDLFKEAFPDWLPEHPLVTEVKKVVDAVQPAPQPVLVVPPKRTNPATVVPVKVKKIMPAETKAKIAASHAARKQRLLLEKAGAEDAA
jgi:hypothetical protein